MIFWLALAAAMAWLLWFMVKVPGVSYAGALKPLTEEERVIAANLRAHVAAIASREHNFLKAAELEAAALYIEQALAGPGRLDATLPVGAGGSAQYRGGGEGRRGGLRDHRRRRPL